MNALYPRLAGLCAVLLGMGGCSGRTAEGLWFGPMPGTPYADCRIELHRGGAVQATCMHTPPVSWRGTFRVDGDRFYLHRASIQEGDVLLKGESAEMEFQASGPGNKMALKGPDGQVYVWERRLE